MRNVKAFLFAMCLVLTPTLAWAAPDGGAAVDMAVASAVDAGAPAAASGDLGSFVRQAYDAAQRHDYRMLAAVLLIGFVAVARKYGARVPGHIGAFVASDRGGAFLSLGLALIAGVIHALLAGSQLGLGMIATAVYISFLASGGYALVKKAGLVEWLAGAAKRILPALLIGAALTAGGCAWLQAHPTVAAALKCTESLVLAALEDVGAAFASGQVDWAAIGHAEEVHGLDAVVCAAQRLANPPAGAAVNVAAARGAQEYLAVRGL